MYNVNVSKNFNYFENKCRYVIYYATSTQNVPECKALLSHIICMLTGTQ